MLTRTQWEMKHEDDLNGVYCEIDELERELKALRDRADDMEAWDYSDYMSEHYFDLEKEKRVSGL